MTTPKHHHQNLAGEDKNRCSWFAVRHFLETEYRWDEFANIAATGMVNAFGMDRNLCRQEMEEGVDPAFLRQFFEPNMDVSDGITFPEAVIPEIDRIIICTNIHFLALLKVDGIWMNYDSLLNEPKPVPGNVNAFLKDKAGRHFFWASRRPRKAATSSGFVDLAA